MLSAAARSARSTAESAVDRLRRPQTAPRSGAPRCCCSAPCTSICVVAASAVLLGSNTSASRPLPKSGRITRSPGEVNSTCSIRSRMWSVRRRSRGAAAAVEVVGEVERRHGMLLTRLHARLRRSGIIGCRWR